MKGHGERVTRGVAVAVVVAVGDGVIGVGVLVGVRVNVAGGVGVIVGVRVGVHVAIAVDCSVGLGVFVATTATSLGAGGNGLIGRYGLTAMRTKQSIVMIVKPSITRLSVLNNRPLLPIVASSALPSRKLVQCIFAPNTRSCVSITAVEKNFNKFPRICIFTYR